MLFHKILQATGKVTYNGHEFHEFIPQRTSAYISQRDIQTAEMNVRETLDFSGRCQGVGSRFGECSLISLFQYFPASSNLNIMYVGNVCKSVNDFAI
jgi:ABC-type multidrug transport system ATPase subunit